LPAIRHEKKEPWRGGPNTVTDWDAGSYACHFYPFRHPRYRCVGGLVSAIFTGERFLQGLIHLKAGQAAAGFGSGPLGRVVGPDL